MIIITGGAGFIGSNQVRHLNADSIDDLLIVDEINNEEKVNNIADCKIKDMLDKKEFIEQLNKGKIINSKVECVLHLGACTDTTQWDAQFMLENNYTYSRVLMDACVKHNVPFIYASSAAVYGTGKSFTENPLNEHPVNVYAYSKLLFDQYVRFKMPEVSSQLVGLRYFNVYGPGEQHKQHMASVVFQLNKQINKGGIISLFRGSGGYTDGEQRRDFIHVDDVVSVNNWFMGHGSNSGVFNVGTGNSRSFNEIARLIISFYGKGNIKYIDFPEKLEHAYQSFTEADITKLKNAGYKKDFISLEDGISSYLGWLSGSEV